MSLWQPRSLLQLVLVSFFAALAPFGMAILFTVDTLGDLSDQNRAVTHSVVDATRLGHEIQRDVIELERRARQFFALADPEFADLFYKERDIISGKLKDLHMRVPTDSPEIMGLLHTLSDLSLVTQETSAQNIELADAATDQAQESEEHDQIGHAFFMVGEQSKAVKIWLQSSVDRLVRDNAQEADAQIKKLVLQLSLLAGSTLALLILLAYWINRPVRDLTQEIHQLGTTGLSHSIEISGPLELQTLGTELEWLRKSLHRSEQQKEQFLLHISHELKTPLSSLREGADLLADQVTGHLSQQQHEIVNIVQQNGIELQRLIENLIDYNRLPNQELSLEEFSLDELWQELLSNYRLSLDKKALQLQQIGEVNTWTADRYKLKTSLDNLLSNAISYTPDGGMIDIAWSQRSDQLVIDVANSGDPIPHEDSERVFEPFFQSVAKRSGPIKGSGIGLSVARDCIEAQGGELNLATHSALPICFRLTCPAY